jgi:DNA invertase Pin-like site-specific DNA recombinase
VDRQEADCRELAQRLGWDVVAVFADNDVSAYDRRKVRPQYRHMLEAIRRGDVHGVIAWHPDRLHRRNTELEGFIDLVETHGVQVQTVRAGQYDLATASGQMIARILGAAAQHEVAHSRERVQRAKTQAATDGKYRGGPRPFGYEADGMTVRESEARVIRDATKAVLAGRTLASIARELREQGVTGTRGKPITYNNLRDMLLRPRNAGILAKGLPNRNATTNNSTRAYQEIGPAAWPAVVPEEEWRALVKLLTDGDRLTAPVTEKRWIGSGIYRCGVPVMGEDGETHPCGGVLRVAPHGGTARRPFERRYLYRCTQSAHLTISQKETDAFVSEVVVDLVRDPAIVALMAPGDARVTADREKRSLLAARLAEFESDYIEGRIPAALWQKSTARVQTEIDEVDAKLAKALSRSASSSILRAADPGQAFLDAPLDVQRAVLASLINVEVVPAPSRGGRWTAERLRITRAS